MSTAKLEELILYIAQQCSDDPNFGATKLNKILFFADFLAYGHLGHSITGATYINRNHGPAPRPILLAQRNLVDSGRAVMAERTHFGYTQKRVLPLVPASLAPFAPEELRIVDETIRKLETMNATELSEFTHKFRPWRDTVEGEEIPYFTVFVMDNLPATRGDKEWATARIAEVEMAGA